MKLKELYSKSIDRQVNPAVVVGKQDAETIKIEINEYVFTKDLVDNLYRFLHDIVHKQDAKTSIWISGYYGSGKSHFIKYVYYCLNPQTSEQAIDHFIKNAAEVADAFSDATPSNIKILKNKIAEYEIDTIIFNIDAVSGQKNEKEKITKIFLNQFNAFRGFNSTNIALALLLEKHLDEVGSFKDFKKDIYQKFKKEWKTDASTLVSLKLTDVLNIAQKYDGDIDLDSLRAKLKSPDDITIKDTLIPEFKDYLSKKDDNYRLVYMVDEVSQYIGVNTNLLLNLQTIVEEISADCDNKIWLACTAQQTLDQIIDSTEIHGEDFGKILGRFETRISLQSQDAAYITQKRILDKNSSGTEELIQFYDKNKDTIDNQYVFNHELYSSYVNRDQFLLAYPFLPYQFRLIADVFDSFSGIGYVIKEVKDNERSVLAITHSTALNSSNEEVGHFIPFDAFFNQLFQRNLTHHARGIIDRASKLQSVQEDGFAKRVVYTLFMIANLSDTKRITFPANLDNLTLLLMDQPDVNKLELQNRIEKVLDLLIKNSIISPENGDYRFFKEDEIEVAALIQNQIINREDRITAIWEDIVINILSLQRRVSYGSNNFSLSLKVDEKYIFKGGDIYVFISAFENTTPAQKALTNNKNDLVVCINEWFFNHPEILSEIELFTKTKKYIRQNSDSATGTRKQTIEMFGNKNSNRKTDLIKTFQTKFIETPFISGQQVINPADLSSREPAKRFAEVLQGHFSEIYKKNKLAPSYTNDELKKQAMTHSQTSADKTLTTGESEIENYLNTYGQIMTVEDLIKNFLKPPYGWKDTSSIGLLLKLGLKRKRQFEWRNQPIDFKEFVEYALKSNERNAIVIKDIVEVGELEVQDAKRAYLSIFNEQLSDQTDSYIVFDRLKSKLSITAKKYASYEDNYSMKPFGKHFHEIGKVLREWLEIREPKQLFDKVIERKDDIRELNDTCKDVIEFIDHQYKNYETIQKFERQNRQNFEVLDVAEKANAESLSDYLEKEDRPGDRFPQMKKIYEEIQNSIKDQSKNLQKETRSAYADIFVELDNKATELKVADVSGYYDKTSKLAEIDKETNLTHLQLLKANAGMFRTDAVEQIIKASQKDPENKKQIERFDIKATQIASEEELDLHLNWLRSELMKKLKENKIILLVKE
ncbi:MAG: BREX system P-loop protein BrxC [Calditrichaeota bacterium]|nr:MAG: BREX system P-loop protein BrxC [Calditrichota bacterium]MBL1207138.1 BREX system P-loop protein BrxC [Calditrichota bacterium]NOG46968.1 BREX system P-loop protein BrxC [Calditrichota bacterium]